MINRDNIEDNPNSLATFIVTNIDSKTVRYVGISIFIFVMFVILAITFPPSKSERYKDTEEYATKHIIEINSAFSLTSDKLIKDSLVRRANEYIELLDRNKETHSNYIRNCFIFFISYILLVIITFLYNKKKRTNIPFHCPSCSRAILVSSLNNLTCPVCNLEAKSILKLILGCKHCDTKLKYIECPHCHEDINLFNNYNDKEIKQKIYNS